MFAPQSVIGQDGRQCPDAVGELRREPAEGLFLRLGPAADDAAEQRKEDDHDREWRAGASAPPAMTRTATAAAASSGPIPSMDLRRAVADHEAGKRVADSAAGRRSARRPAWCGCAPATFRDSASCSAARSRLTTISPRHSPQRRSAKTPAPLDKARPASAPASAIMSKVAVFDQPPGEHRKRPAKPIRNSVRAICQQQRVAQARRCRSSRASARAWPGRSQAPRTRAAVARFRRRCAGFDHSIIRIAISCLRTLRSAL